MTTYSMSGEKLLFVDSDFIPRIEFKDYSNIANTTHLIYVFAMNLVYKARIENYDGFYKTRKMIKAYYKKEVLMKTGWILSYEDKLLKNQPNMFLFEFIKSVVEDGNNFLLTLNDKQQRVLSAELNLIRSIKI